MDPRVVEHARILVDYSAKIAKGDNVLIYLNDQGMDLATEIYRRAATLGANSLICHGGHPWDATETELLRAYYMSTPEEYLGSFPQHHFELVKASNVIIHLRSAQNTLSLACIDPKKISVRTSALKRLIDEGMSKRWCITQYPTTGYAQQAEMSLREYEDFAYSAILQDWEKQTETMNRLKAILDRTRELRIVGPQTDLTMSIKGRTAIICNGHHNMPDGEVYTAPTDDSANGYIFYDMPAVRFGREVTGIKLTLKNGEIVDYSANKNEDLLKAMINTDMGSRRFGELGIGMNRQISRFTKNILFDEKIGGTVHLAIGNAFKDCGGTNQSALHWDMIKSMKDGKIICDGEVLQENGKFRWE